MSEGQIIGLTITILASLALIAGAVWLIFVARKPLWPKGARTEGTYRGHRSVVVFDPSFIYRGDASQVSLQVAKAAWALARAWQEKKGKNIFGDLETVGAWILADAEFEKITKTALPHRDPLTVSAWLSSANQRLGNAPPMAVMRATHVEHLIATGQPAIHEFLHSVDGLRFDLQHKAIGIWDNPNQPGTIEGRAGELFLVVQPLEATA